MRLRRSEGRVGSLVPKFQGAEWQGGQTSSGKPGLGRKGRRSTRREPVGFPPGTSKEMLPPNPTAT